jgi:hypothetical protein
VSLKSEKLSIFSPWSRLTIDIPYDQLTERAASAQPQTLLVPFASPDGGDPGNEPNSTTVTAPELPFDYPGDMWLDYFPDSFDLTLMAGVDMGPSIAVENPAEFFPIQRGLALLSPTDQEVEEAAGRDDAGKSVDKSLEEPSSDGASISK